MRTCRDKAIDAIQCAFDGFGTIPNDFERILVKSSLGDDLNEFISRLVECLQKCDPTFVTGDFDFIDDSITYADLITKICENSFLKDCL